MSDSRNDLSVKNESAGFLRPESPRLAFHYTSRSFPFTYYPPFDIDFSSLPPVYLISPIQIYGYGPPAA